MLTDRRRRKKKLMQYKTLPRCAGRVNIGADCTRERQNVLGLNPPHKDFTLCACDVCFMHIFDRKFCPLLLMVPDRLNIFCRPGLGLGFRVRIRVRV